MNRNRISLLDILQPRQFKTTPERSKVTRTIIQPEIDTFEAQEALQAAAPKTALEKRRPQTSAHV